jgi:hypothetical protein
MAALSLANAGWLRRGFCITMGVSCSFTRYNCGCTPGIASLGARCSRATGYVRRLIVHRCTRKNCTAIDGKATRSFRR